MKEIDYKICQRCVMDTSVEDIKFDNKGICNYCSDFLKNSSNVLEINPSEQNLKLKTLIK